MTRVAGLFLYPVKSLRGIEVSTAEVDELGFSGDRRFLVVDDGGTFLTQRTLPRMALVSTALTDGLLHLSAGGAGMIAVPTAPDSSARPLQVRVWSQDGLVAEDCGEAAAAWLGGILERKCRLVRLGPAFHRPVKRQGAGPGDQLSFADGAPLLLATTSSLDELNRRIRESGDLPVPMSRFRPNLVLEGSEPFAEDDWERLVIGGVHFRASGPCERCILTTTDPLTGQRGKEPLKTLASFRRNPQGAVLFGVNLIQESKAGHVRVGDAVNVT